MVAIQPSASHPPPRQAQTTILHSQQYQVILLHIILPLNLLTYIDYITECKVWRNPLNLLRGGEYQRFNSSTGKDPLTYYDMNLSAQDHQTYFTCEADVGKQEYESNFQVSYFKRGFYIIRF